MGWGGGVFRYLASPCHLLGILYYTILQNHIILLVIVYQSFREYWQIWAVLTDICI